MSYITPPEHSKDIALLLVRVIIAASFIVASRNKSRDLKGFAKKNGLPVAVAFFVMLAEFASGICLLLGIYAQLAAIVIILLMLGTLRLHLFKWHSPYWADRGGWEYDFIMFTLAAVIFVFGAGNLALVR